ncbi:response regulator transcription factor [Arthrobacter tecti]
MTGEAEPIRVAVVDDQPVFLAGLQMLIDSQQDMVVCATAGDGEAAVALAATRSPDIILMDLRMPLMNGIVATSAITAGQEADHEGPKIIALTTFNRDRAAIDAIRSGASGYVLKSAEPEFLLAAIRTVNSGFAVIAPEATHDLFTHAQDTGPAREPAPQLEAIAALTPREKDIFLLAAKGLSNSDIAKRVYVSAATVKSDVRSILNKLSLLNRIQIVAYAYEHHLIPRAVST